MNKQSELSLNELDAVTGAGFLEYIKETINALGQGTGNSGNPPPTPTPTPTPLPGTVWV